MDTNQLGQVSTPDADNSGELRTSSGQDERVTAITEGILGSLRESGCMLRTSAFSHIAPWVRKAMEPTPPAPVEDILLRSVQTGKTMTLSEWSKAMRSMTDRVASSAKEFSRKVASKINASPLAPHTPDVLSGIIRAELEQMTEQVDREMTTPPANGPTHSSLDDSVTKTDRFINLTPPAFDAVVGATPDERPSLAKKIGNHLLLQFPATEGHIPLKDMLRSVSLMEQLYHNEMARSAYLERQLAETRAHLKIADEQIRLERGALAEAWSKGNDYRLAAIGAEDALKKMTEHRDRLAKALEKTAKDFIAFRNIARENGIVGTLGLESLELAAAALATVPPDTIRVTDPKPRGF